MAIVNLADNAPTPLDRAAHAVNLMESPLHTLGGLASTLRVVASTEETAADVTMSMLEFWADSIDRLAEDLKERRQEAHDAIREAAGRVTPNAG
jgi:hypothetical protein